MHLMGNRRHAVDAKLRIKLPADFHRQFEGKMCLLPLDEVLYGFTPQGHERFVEDQFKDGYNPRDRNQVNLRRMLNALTVTVDIDSAGRICLGKVPERYRPWLKKGCSVVLVGNEGHLEIWDEARWDAFERQTVGELEKLMFDA